MVTRLIHRGRVAWANGRLDRPTASNLDEDGNQVFCHPITGVIRQLQTGGVWHDAEDELNFRVVENSGVLQESAGWQTMEKWARTLQVSWPSLRSMVRANLFDAAIERGSAQRCLRALDPDRVHDTARLMREAEQARRRAKRR